MRLASERISKNEDASYDDAPSTSGRQMSEISLHKSSFNCQDMVPFECLTMVYVQITYSISVWKNVFVLSSS